MDQVNNGEQHIQMRHARPLTAFQEHLFEILLQAYETDDKQQEESNDFSLNENELRSDIACIIEEENNTQAVTCKLENTSDNRMDRLEAQRETLNLTVLEIDHTKTIAAHMRWIFPMVMLINIIWLHLLEDVENLSEVVQTMISIAKWSLILLLTGCCIYQGYLIIHDKQQNECSMDDVI
ncbi:MAG: hypothetical protein KHW81_15835 [[Clostridium] innocuum]|nr:hypothetical protein [[Clostridium] innocuum]MBS5685842.1 hypothetical protein [[Clostridium] innocuum]